MCVVMPGKVISIDAPSTGAVWSQVEFGDRVLKVNLVMLPDVDIGDHVLVHSGYAIRRVLARVVDDASRTHAHDHESHSRSR
jgi:hydrogenase expression/formation protein HypC